MCFGQDYLSVKYGVNNGLLSNDNYRVYQDLDGYIWILSEKGITKFNGKTFKYFTTEQGLKTNDVWDMGIDSHNRKWLKTFSSGLQYIKNDSVITISGTEKYGQLVHIGEHRDTVFFMQYDQDRNSKKRFFVTKNDSFGTYIKQKQGYPLAFDYEPYGVQYYRSGATLGHFTGNQFNNNNELFSLFSYDGTPPNENQPVLMFLHQNKQKKWGYFKDNQLQDFSLSKLTDLPIIKLFYDAKYNRVIVQTTERFFVLKDLQKLERDNRMEQRLNENKELKTLVISHITVDSEQNLWVVKNRGEVFFFPNSMFTYRKLICFADEQIGNTITLCNYNPGTFFMDRPNILYKITPDDVIHKINLAVTIPSIRQFECHKDKLFFISDYFLIKYDVNTSISTVLYNDKHRLFSFAFIDENKLIFSNGDVLDVRTKKVVSKVKLPEKVTTVIYLDGNVVYSYEDTIYVMDLKTNHTRELFLNNVQSIKVIQNQLFAITGKDLYTVDINRLKTKKIHASSHEIRHISFQNEKINLITDRYLIFAGIDFKKQVLFDLSYVNLKPYGFQVNSIKWKDNNTAYLYTTDGVFLIRKFEQEDNVLTIPFKLKSNNKQLKDTIFLNSDSSLLVDIEPISYASFGEVTYRYRLSKEGRNQQYIYTNEDKLLINHLAPGNYILYVESAPNSFSEYGNGYTVKIVVDPLFQETLFFKVIVALFIVAGFFFTVFFTKRLMSIRNKRNVRIKELELSALRAQLNPHFVFNVLNGIQGIMMYQSKEKANEYIYSFSELIRIVLNNSKQIKVALSEELKLIRNYLELENMRLDNTLHYSIDNRSNIDPESIPVYGMIIQPFVENSIVHGFKTNQQNKQITIAFEVEKGYLEITIEDNGIGKNKADQMKKDTPHKSWASTILQEKSELLNSMHEKELIIHTVDLEDEKGNTGTRVLIVMKIH